MITNQRKMMMKTTTRNSHFQWRQKQPKTKEYQSKGGIFKGTGGRKYRSRGGIKTREMEDVERLMFSEEEPPPELKVASNHLILKNIMAQVTFSTLKAARLVCKEWKELANLELGRRKCARMVLKSNNQFQPLLRTIRNSDDIFSWMEFGLYYLDVDELTAFTTLFGHQVKIMKLLPSDSSPRYPRDSKWETIWDFITDGKFPNLEILRFHKGSSHRFGFFSRPSGWSPNAEMLPNLREIEGIHLSDFSRFPSGFLKDQGHLVKSVELDICEWGPRRGVLRWGLSRDITSILDYITLLAQAKPQLERLVIENLRDGVLEQFVTEEIEGDFDWSMEFAKHINLLLESSREAVQTLEISLHRDSPFYFQPQPQLPLSHKQSYNKLSTLHFCIDTTCSNFQKQMESLDQECVPNLQTVQIEVHYSTKLCFPAPLSFSPGKEGRGRGRLTSVVNFELKGQYLSALSKDLLPSFWFPWLSACFPNIRNFTTEIWRDVDEVLRHVFLLWPKLTSLSIRVDCETTTTAKSNLDPVFTGLSVEKCQELRRHPEKMKMQMKMTRGILTRRAWPNLNSLKELKRLEFTVTGHISPPFWSPVSLVSFLCAINLLPELETTICFPEKAQGYRKFLKPLATYAQLEGFTGSGWPT